MGRISWYRINGLVVWEAYCKTADSKAWERFQKGTLYDCDGDTDQEVSRKVAQAAFKASGPIRPIRPAGGF